MNTASKLSLLHLLFLKLAAFCQTGVLNSTGNLAIGNSLAHFDNQDTREAVASFLVFKLKKLD